MLKQKSCKHIFVNKTFRREPNHFWNSVPLLSWLQCAVSWTGVALRGLGSLDGQLGMNGNPLHHPSCLTNPQPCRSSLIRRDCSQPKIKQRRIQINVNSIVSCNCNCYIYYMCNYYIYYMYTM